MRIINISAAAKNHLSDNFYELMEQINSAAIAVVEPLSAYGFVQNGVEHVYIECAEDSGDAANDVKFDNTPIGDVSGFDYEAYKPAEIRLGSKVKLADSRYIVKFATGECLHPEKAYTVCQASYQDGALESISLNEIISSDFRPEYFKLVDDDPTADAGINLSEVISQALDAGRHPMDEAVVKFGDDGGVLCDGWIYPDDIKLAYKAIIDFENQEKAK